MCVVGHMCQGLLVTAVVDLNLQIPMPAFCVKHLLIYISPEWKYFIESRPADNMHTSGSYTKTGFMY